MRSTLGCQYATWDNFTGKPVDGYLANRIAGTRALYAALERARIMPDPRLWLPSLDGYRPQRAVDRFLRWSKQPEDAGRSYGTIRILTEPRCSKKDMWPQSRATAGQHS